MIYFALFLALQTIAVVFVSLGRMKKLLAMMQLVSYRNNEYDTWLDRNKHLAYSYSKYRSQDKTPLVMTERAKRLLNFQICLSAFLILVSGIVLIALHKHYGLDLKLAVLILLIVDFLVNYFQVILIKVANFIEKPIEDRINAGFYKQAQSKISADNSLIKIGITGSFGKTSTKFIVYSILSRTYKVLTTPSSYNTPMGISKVINNELNEDFDVFVAEMGARRTGDINELVELVHPKIGIITSIGSAHLETFKTLENVAKAKYELISGLPKDGIAIFNYDNEHIKKLADITNIKKYCYGIEPSINLDVFANDIYSGENGSTFTLNIRGENPVVCQTALLGKHNVSNILAGVCVAVALGMRTEDIVKGIADIKPVEHRLQLIDPKTGILVIDDSFNANPTSVKAALEVLKTFKGKRKIIITPGMIELGNFEKIENKQFGALMADVCDLVILVGKKRSEAIIDGLRDKSYPENKIFVAEDLKEATEIYSKLSMKNDVVLYENDLPDNYREN